VWNIEQIRDLRQGGRRQCLAGEFLCCRSIHLLNEALDPQYPAWRDGQGGDADSDENGYQREVLRHVSAKGKRLVVMPGSLHDGPYGSKDCRMPRHIPVGDLFVRTVNG